MADLVCEAGGGQLGKGGQIWVLALPKLRSSTESSKHMAGSYGPLHPITLEI